MIAIMTVVCRALLLFLLALLVPAAAAQAQEFRPPILSQLSGSAGCVALPGAEASRACRPADGLNAPEALIADPSGRDLYAASAKADRIVHLRAAGSGGLRYGDCVGTGTHDCRRAAGLQGVSQLTMSADGQWMVALAHGSSTITLLSRDRSGRLRPRSCVTARRNRERRNCSRVPLLSGATAVGMSTDGHDAYVALGDRQALIGVRREGRRLRVLPVARACAVDEHAHISSLLRGCRRTRGLGSPNAVALSRDGRNIYTTSASPSSVAVLRRSPRSGALRPVACLNDDGADRCRPASALAGSSDVVASADGNNVYVVATTDRAVSAFARNGDGSLDQIGCYGAAPRLAGSCAGVPVLVAPQRIALAPSGDRAYVVDSSSSTVTAFHRQFAGDLTAEGPPQGCVSPFAGCEPAHGILAATGVAVGADSRYVYASSPLESTVAAFRLVNK